MEKLTEKLTVRSASKEFPAFNGIRKLITCSQETVNGPFLSQINPNPNFLRYALILPSQLYLGLPSGLFPSRLSNQNFLRIFHLPFAPRPCMKLPNMLIFYGEDLLAPRPTPSLENHPLSAVHDCLLNIFATAVHISPT
jgi:hypothetical protein